MQWVSYTSVNFATGESGLGLAARKNVVLRFIGNDPLIAEFTEAGSRFGLDANIVVSRASYSLLAAEVSLGRLTRWPSRN